jgi:hypothetical protein
MNLFVRHYIRFQHDQEKDEGFEEKLTKVVSTCNIDGMQLGAYFLQSND